MSAKDYNLSCLLAKRLAPGGPRGKRPTVEYLVQWEGYTPADNTWEPLANLTGCMALVHSFELLTQLPTWAHQMVVVGQPVTPTKPVVVVDISDEEEEEEAPPPPRRRRSAAPPAKRTKPAKPAQRAMEASEDAADSAEDVFLDSEAEEPPLRRSSSPAAKRGRPTKRTMRAREDTVESEEEEEEAAPPAKRSRPAAARRFVRV